MTKFDQVCRKVDELVDVHKLNTADLLLVRRFSGGGTVIVDHNTMFVTFIMQSSAVPSVPCYPRPIMQWTERIYKPVFDPYGPFALVDNGKFLAQ